MSLLLVLWMCGGSIARAESAEVESLIAQGNELREKGQPDRALPLFQKAFALAQTPRTEGQLGLAEMAAGHPVEAEQHLVAALESREHPWIAKTRPGLEKTLALARSKIGEISVEGEPSGAVISVNGRTIGALPLATPIRLAAGRVEIVVSASGYSPVSRSLHLAGGEHQRIAVSLDKAPATGAPSGTATSTAPSSTTSPSAASPGATGPGAAAAPGSVSPTSATVAPLPSATSSVTSSLDAPPVSTTRTLAWGLAAGGLAGLGAGLGLQLEAIHKMSVFNGSCEVLHGTPGAKQGVTSVTDSGCQDLYNSWNGYKLWSVVGYAAGAGMALTSAILFWTSGSPAHRVDLGARLTCAPGPGSVSCRGEF
jgi:hypothetical protein